MDISFTPVTPEDMGFLKKVYRSTREEEMNLTDWDESQKTAFIDQQFQAQHDYYRQVYSGATFSIIHLDGIPAGRLYIWESDSQIRIMDIALLPGFRNKGAGTSILSDLIRTSEENNKILSIHVENYNPALQLYLRLGFEKKDQTGVYYYLERHPKKQDHPNS